MNHGSHSGVANAPIEPVIIICEPKDAKRLEKNRKYFREYNARRRAERRAKGLCVKCAKPNPRSLDVGQCDECTREALGRNAKYQRKAMIAGLCIVCREPNDDGFQLCPKCRKARAKRYYDKAASKDTCAQCSGPKEIGKSRCPKCAEAIRLAAERSREKKKKAGKCMCCGGDKGSMVGLKCMKCRFKADACSFTGNAKNWTLLRDLFEKQNGKCAYTGLPLTLGKDASLDHKHPRSLGGADCVTNFQWVLWKVNRSKLNMTHEEFISMCRHVADQFPIIPASPCAESADSVAPNVLSPEPVPPPSPPSQSLAV